MSRLRDPLLAIGMGLMFAAFAAQGLGVLTW